MISLSTCRTARAEVSVKIDRSKFQSSLWSDNCGATLEIVRLFEMVSGQAVIVMGVTGAGKSTVGGLLAAELGCAFLDADNFHSAENKEKMRRGAPLTDSDRMPWLETLRDTLIEYILRGQCVVLACSALLPKYRDLLRTADYEFLPEAVVKCSEDATATSDGKDSHEQAREGRSASSHVVFVYLKCRAEILAPRVIAREVADAEVRGVLLLYSWG
ncbi:hypothetical protein M758_UG102600 [Ceratodon purpureus]|nr:hypothetical protein M758_UG102600 [Ceratodon purpureus]